MDVRLFLRRVQGLMVLLLGQLAVAVTAAEPARPDPERILPGRWVSDLDGLALVVRSSGRFAVVPPDRPPLEGTWWVENDVVHFRNAPDVPVCRDVTGRYRLSTTPEGVTFTAIDDDCPTRKAHLESTLRPDAR